MGTTNKNLASSEPMPWGYLAERAREYAAQALSAGDSRGAAAELKFAEFCDRRRLCQPWEPPPPEGM